MAGKFKIEWAQRAVADLDRIYDNLLQYWGTKEANSFLDLVREFELLLLRYPEAFVVSKKIRSCRLGLIHKNVSAVYIVKKDTIYIVALFDNRTKTKYR